uniref:Mitochondrial 2-oxoglutarate/malate carrier protein n=1 Tax=Fusarium oxysporum (strain Fo5176) TaxID=660025 RepID=A0A0D2XKK7_FUSOF
MDVRTELDLDAESMFSRMQVLKSNASMLNVLYRFAARDGKKLSVAQNIACAGVAGGVAGLVGNPAEVVLVRMCADGAKAPAQQFGYAHAFDALARVYSEEGMRAFWKGIAPNIARSALMNRYPLEQWQQLYVLPQTFSRVECNLALEKKA